VKKTGRVMIADVGVKTAGVGAEIAALIMEKVPCLKAPLVRIALPDTPTPASPVLEKAYYRGQEDIIVFAKRMMNG